MTDQHPTTPPKDLIDKWSREAFSADDPHLGYVRAAQWGADQQLEQDAKWLDYNSLNESHLRIVPVGKCLKEAMRPKPPSLKEQALDSWDRLRNEAWCQEIDSDLDFIRRALEALPND